MNCMTIKRTHLYLCEIFRVVCKFKYQNYNIPFLKEASCNEYTVLYYIVLRWVTIWCRRYILFCCVIIFFCWKCELLLFVIRTSKHLPFSEYFIQYITINQNKGETCQLLYYLTIIKLSLKLLQKNKKLDKWW